MLTVQPAEAQVVIDGEATGDRDLYLQPGPHALKVTAPGLVDYIEPVKLAANETKELTVKLQAKDAGTPPIKDPKKDPKDVPLKDPKDPKDPSKPNLKPGDLAPPKKDPVLVPVPIYQQPGWICVAGGGAALVASGVVGGLALSNSSTLSTITTGGASGDPVAVRSTMLKQAWTSTVLTGVGVAVVGAGVALILAHVGDSPVPAEPDKQPLEAR